MEGIMKKIISSLLFMATIAGHSAWAMEAGAMVGLLGVQSRVLLKALTMQGCVFSNCGIGMKLMHKD